MNIEDLDVLREVFNIGACHASTALSKLTGKHVKVFFPKLEFARIEEVTKFVGKPSLIVSVVYCYVEAEENNSKKPFGGFLFILPQKCAIKLAKMLTNESGEDLSDLDISALKEAGNIILGNCLTAISNWLKIRLWESVPEFANDLLGAIINDLLINFALKTDYVLILKTEFSIEDQKISGSFVLMFEREGYELILRKTSELLEQ